MGSPKEAVPDYVGPPLLTIPLDNVVGRLTLRAPPSPPPPSLPRARNVQQISNFAHPALSSEPSNPARRTAPVAPIISPADQFKPRCVPAESALRGHVKTNGQIEELEGANLSLTRCFSPFWGWRVSEASVFCGGFRRLFVEICLFSFARFGATAPSGTGSLKSSGPRGRFRGPPGRPQGPGVRPERSEIARQNVY
jgi:hypothetical protein